MKIRFRGFLALSLGLVASVTPIFGAGSGFNAGGYSARLEPGQAATRGKTFGDNFYQPGGTGGQVVANTNIFTGQPSYTVPLYTLNARNEVAFPFNITYSGPALSTVENNNEQAPSGWIGVGWSMSIPFVAVNHKGTFTYSDDVVMCNLGSYGGGQILRAPSSDGTGRYYVATAPGIRVELDTVSNSGSPLYRQIKEWRFIMPNGVRLSFGNSASDEVANSQRTVQYNNGVIVASPYNTSVAKPFVYRWDIRRMEDASRKTGIDFEYEKFTESLWGGTSYVRESYLKSALWRDEYGNEIQRVDLETEARGVGEYSGYLTDESRRTQKLFGSRRLKSLSMYAQGIKIGKTSFTQSVQTSDYGKKAFLTGIGTTVANDRTTPGWSFTYADGNLKKITMPSGVEEEYEYLITYLSGEAADQQGSSFLKNQSGTVVTDLGLDDWGDIQSTCDDRFCYQRVEGIKVVVNASWRVYIRVFHNTGNFFGEPVFQKDFSKTNDASTWYNEIIPMGDYFLLVNEADATVDIWEWNGKTFEQKDDFVEGELSDPIKSNFGGKTRVYPGSNYFVVQKDTVPGRTWVYLKNPATGNWKNLTYGDTLASTCRIPNPPIAKTSGGAWINPKVTGNSACLTWDSKITVSTGPKSFVIGANDAPDNDNEFFRVLYMYALNSTGDGFDFVSPRIKFVADSLQGTYSGTEYPAYWDFKIDGEILMADDYFLMKSHKQPGGSGHQTYSRYDAMFFDGDSVRRVDELNWEADDGNNTGGPTRWDRRVWIKNNYLVQANTESPHRRIEVRKWKSDGSKIYLGNPDILRTDLVDETDMDYAITLGNKHVAIEYYPDEELGYLKAENARPSYFSNGMYKTWLYRIKDSGIDSLSTGAPKYSWPWPSSCSTKLWQMSFSGVDDVVMGLTQKNEGQTGCRCAAEDDCETARASATLKDSSSYFITDPMIVPDAGVVDPGGGTDSIWREIWSSGSRLAQTVRLVQEPSLGFRLVSRRYFFNGRSFNNFYNLGAPLRVKRVAKRFSSDSVVAEFSFGDFEGSIVQEFNHNSLTPQYEYAKVTYKGVPGSTVYTQYVDQLGHRLQQDSAGLSGRVHTITTLNDAGQVIAMEHTDYLEPYTRTGVNPWPAGVAMNRAEGTTSRQWADNRSYHTNQTHYHAYHDTLETPLFNSTENGDRVLISQSILDPEGLRIARRLGYDYPASEEPTAGEYASHRTTPLETDGGEGKYAIAQSQMEYDPVFKYKPIRTYGWRDPGGYSTDEELKAGPIPDYDPSAEVFLASEVSKRDSLGQVLESYVEDGTVRHWTSVFYEGRAALPVGVVMGAQRANAAVLTAENANVSQLLGLGKLDRDKVWDAPGVTYDSLQVHTGRYSFKVTDHFGPSGNLYLKDVLADSIGFIASAWVYGDSDVEPIFSVSRRHANHAEQNEVRAAPVEGTYVRGKWQRWEARLTHAQLVANGMFDGSDNDYLRFFIGHGSPSSTPSKVIYVDDIVLRPDNSLFTLTAYNERGLPTHRSDANHRVITTNYGDAGQPTATRDDQGRIFRQEGFNRLGENQ